MAIALSTMLLGLVVAVLSLILTTGLCFPPKDDPFQCVRRLFHLIVVPWLTTMAVLCYQVNGLHRLAHKYNRTNRQLFVCGAPDASPSYTLLFIQKPVCEDNDDCPNWKISADELASVHAVELPVLSAPVLDMARKRRGHTEEMALCDATQQDDEQSECLL